MAPSSINLVEQVAKIKLLIQIHGKGNQRQFANKADVVEGSISGWLRNAPMSQNTIIKICKRLLVTHDIFVNGSFLDFAMSISADCNLIESITQSVKNNESQHAINLPDDVKTIFSGSLSKHSEHIFAFKGRYARYVATRREGVMQLEREIIDFDAVPGQIFARAAIIKNVLSGTPGNGFLAEYGDRLILSIFYDNGYPPSLYLLYPPAHEHGHGTYLYGCYVDVNSKPMKKIFSMKTLIIRQDLSDDATRYVDRTSKEFKLIYPLVKNEITDKTTRLWVDLSEPGNVNRIGVVIKELCRQKILISQ